MVSLTPSFFLELDLTLECPARVNRLAGQLP